MDVAVRNNKREFHSRRNLSYTAELHAGRLTLPAIITLTLSLLPDTRNTNLSIAWNAQIISRLMRQILAELRDCNKRGNMLLVSVSSGSFKRQLVLTVMKNVHHISERNVAMGRLCFFIHIQ